VKAARKHLNFSEFANLAPAQQQEMLFEMVKQIQFGIMPPRSYQFLHRDSKITNEKFAVIKSYLDPHRPRAAASPDQFAAVDAEYNKWVHGGQSVEVVKPTLNGIATRKEALASELSNRLDKTQDVVCLENRSTKEIDQSCCAI
jgi:hypothetical protein